MLHEVAHGELTIGEIAAPFRTSAAAASKHLKILQRADRLSAKCAAVPTIATSMPTRLRVSISGWRHFCETLFEAGAFQEPTMPQA